MNIHEPSKYISMPLDVCVWMVKCTWMYAENNNQHVWLELQVEEDPFGEHILFLLLVSFRVAIVYPNMAGPGPPKTYPDLFPMQEATCLRYFFGHLGYRNFKKLYKHVSTGCYPPGTGRTMQLEQKHFFHNIRKPFCHTDSCNSRIRTFKRICVSTLPKTNIAPENRPLEKEIPIGNHHF